MRCFKFPLFLLLSVLSSISVNAQRYERESQESVLLNTKFTIDMVWDVQRFPMKPTEGREWKLSRLKAPYDADTRSKINWGPYNDRYLMFELQQERSVRQGSLSDERSRGNYSVLLNLYDPDGRLVKRVSRWGNLMGFGKEGFVYEQEGRFGTFFSVLPLREGDVVVYRPELAIATKLSDIINVNRDEFNDLKLTTHIFREEGSRHLKNAIQKAFYGEFQVADWNDLKALKNINKWISYRRLQDGQTFMVTRNGKYTYGDDRQYFVLYSSGGRPPAGFLVHDRISNKLFLGSWFGEPRQVLIKERRKD